MWRFRFRRLSQIVRARAEHAPDISRFDHGMIRDADVQRRLVEAGVARVKGVVPLGTVEALRVLYEEAMAAYEGPVPEHWFPTGMLSDPELQQRLHDGTSSLAEEVLQSILVPGRAEVLTGSFAVKPVGPSSYLGPHQDASIVDETRTCSINFWIPMTTSVEENGALTFVAGSHRFGNVHRSLGIPWAFEGFDGTMERYSQMLPATVGDIILFDTAIIHGSPANVTDSARIALQGAIIPADEHMEHLSITLGTPPGMVEARRVSSIDLLTGDGVTTASEEMPDLRPFQRPSVSPEQFEDWCRRGSCQRVV